MFLRAKGHSIFISMFFAVFIVRFPTPNGGTASNRQGVKFNNDTVSIPLGNVSSATTAPTLSKKAPITTLKATKMTPTSDALDAGSRHRTFETPNLDPSTALMSTRRPRRTVKRVMNKTSRNHRRRSSHKGTRRRAGQRRKGVVTKSFMNSTAGQANFRNQSNLFGYRKVHPCNTVQTSAMNYTVGNIECRRWKNSELQHQMNCMGTFSQQYLASSFQEALQFKDLDTGRNQDLSRSFIWDRSNSDRVHKRGININPGETLVSQCHAQKSPTESGNLRICPTCAAITRQPATPRRFPQYINELLCDPQMVSNYLPGIDGFCVQKTFTLDLLQFTGDWKLDPTLSAKTGIDVYTEKWEAYTQTIRRHCACELLPSSPMANYL